MNEHMHHDKCCDDLLAEIGEYVDGTLPEDLCILLEQHMAGCPRCRLVVDTTRKTITLYHDTLGNVDLPGEIRQRLFACLNLEEYLHNPDQHETGSAG